MSIQACEVLYHHFTATNLHDSLTLGTRNLTRRECNALNRAAGLLAFAIVVVKFYESYGNMRVMKGGRAPGEPEHRCHEAKGRRAKGKGASGDKRWICLHRAVNFH